jgi:hypothetical protein
MKRVFLNMHVKDNQNRVGLQKGRIHICAASVVTQFEIFPLVGQAFLPVKKGQTRMSDPPMQDH